MTDFIIKRFVKNYEQTDRAEVRASYGLVSGVVGILCNVLLFALKIIVGIFSSSISVIADAVNNLSDASSSVISLVGFKLSQRPADREHPYGHGRYEYLAGLIVAVLIVVIGVELMRESITKIIKPSSVSFSAVSIIILAISILVKLWMMFFNRKLGKTINSKTLMAAAADSRNDVISTLVVLIGAVSAKLWSVQLDGYLGAAVALFVIVSGFGMVKETLDPVLGKAPDAETVENIRRKILSYDGVLGTHDLMVHDYGAMRKFASVHVEMSADGDAIENHDIIDNIERDFLKNENIHLIIHLDPVPSENSELGDLRACISNDVRKLDERITVHDVRKDGQNIFLDCVIPQDMEIGDKEISNFICNIAKTKYPDCVCSVNIDRSFAEIIK